MRLTMRSRLSVSLEGFASAMAVGRIPYGRLASPRLDQVFDFGDGDFGRGGHHGIEILRGFAIDEVAPLVALPRLDESEISLQRALHDIGAAVELARLLALVNYRPNTGRRIERGNARAPGANPLGKRSLRNEVELQGAAQHHLFEQFIFADVGSDVPPDLAVGQKQPHADVIATDVVADGDKVLDAL